MVIGNFRLRIAHDRKERRLADIREADKSHIRNYLELELDFNLSGRLSGLCVFRGLHGAGRVMLVSVAAVPAFEDSYKPVVPGHVRDYLSALKIPDDRSFRHLDDQVLSLFAGAVPLAAVFSVLRAVAGSVPEFSKCIEPFVHGKIDAAAIAAVTAVGAAVRHEFFPAERYVSVSAFSASNNYSGFIYEHNASHRL